jgi:peroxiredoxin Q/BCP
MPELKVGSKAPQIALDTDSGERFKLSAQKGKNVVVFFYPKASTPGCTKEACAFNESLPKIEAANTVVVGISPDPVKAIAKFKEKYGLKFALLADVERQAAEAYGVWAEKSLYGRKYMGVERTTFLVGADGRIAHIFPKVKVEGHAAEVLAALRAL